MGWYAAENALKNALDERDQLVTMLHLVWACATDTGGQTEREAQEIFDKAKELLSEHGVEV